MKLPAIQFYPGDWLRDQVAGCTLAAQGLWMRMMLLMHDSERYGYLSIDGAPMSDEFIARRCGAMLDEYRALIAELDSVKVPSRTQDEIIFSRRMVRDAEKRAQTAKRVRRYRRKHGSNDDVTQSVTGKKHRSSSSISSSASTLSASRRDGKLDGAEIGMQAIAKEAV